MVIILISGSTDSRFITTHDFEAERGVCFGQCKQMIRSEASDGMTVLIRLGDELHHTMEIESNCSIGVGNIRYSTDGPLPDTVNINLAEMDIGYFNTTSQKGEGHLWNVFKDSGPVGQHLQLQSGSYVLELLLSVDDLGVEIDKTTLNFNCDRDPGEIESISTEATVPTTEAAVPTAGDTLPPYEIAAIVTPIAALIVGVLFTGIGIYMKCRKKNLGANMGPGVIFNKNMGSISISINDKDKKHLID